MQAYNGMNLLVGDLRGGSVAYLTNRGKSEELQGARALAPGVHGISNGVLGDRWPKVCIPFIISPTASIWAGSFS